MSGIKHGKDLAPDYGTTPLLLLYLSSWPPPPTIVMRSVSYSAYHSFRPKQQFRSVLLNKNQKESILRADP